LIAARYSLWKIMAKLVVCLTFVMAGVLLIRQPSSSLGAQLCGWGILILFGGDLLTVPMPPTRSVVLRIDNAGVFDGRSMIKPLPWSAVSSALERRLRSRAIYGLRLNESPEQFVKPGWRTFAVKINGYFRSPPFWLSADLLNISGEELRTAIATRVKMK